MKKRLTREGYQLRKRLAEIGVEVTPGELAQGAQEADERIRSGPGGVCVKCGKDDGSDFRFGLCGTCAFGGTP